MIELFQAVQKGVIRQSALLKKNVLPNLTVAELLVALFMVFALAMFSYNLRTIGDANAYYTAAVKSMNQSWRNFFFLAAEPGGGVSVDKPPLGLWIEALFGFMFGVSGLSLSIPNLIAGVLDIPLLYVLMRRYMGDLAGVVAALVLTVTPIFIATHRHNTLDGMLVFAILLAAWCFILATERGQLRWVLAGCVVIGLGFNIKMMQALLPVPAMYALYFLGSHENWWRKLLNLGMGTVLLTVVSLVWVLAVDRTPTAERPFVGSTISNRVTELIFDYNAAKRIFNPATSLSQPGQVEANLPPLPHFIGSGVSYVQQTGVPGVLRFFTPPLSKQMSWLLPFALFSLALAVFGARLRLPLESYIHKALVLWGGWFLTCLVFFSIISGIFHPYYIMIAVPAFCAVVSIGFTLLWNWGVERKWTGILLIFAATGTLAFQWFSLLQFKDRATIVYGGITLLVFGSLLMIWRRRTAYLTILASILIVPFYWSLMTSVTNANQTFPTAYQGGTMRIMSTYVPNDPNLSANQQILSYLQSNTQDVQYLLAVPSALQGMPLVLTSERPVFYMGGFSGLDKVIDANGLKQMVANGDLRYILYGEFFRRPGGVGRGDPEVLKYLKESCYMVPEFEKVIIYTRRSPRPQDLQVQNEDAVTSGPRNDFLTLYLCP